jgi:arylsulfatase
VTETTSIGPKDRWPNGYGFEHFYGFLGGETSQWEPRLTENYDAVEPPENDPTYHLTSDMVDRALAWLDDWRAFDPDQPFLMYWAPGGVHGPHHVFPEWRTSMRASSRPAGMPTASARISARWRWG